MLFHPAWGTLFRSPIPQVKLYDVKSDVGNLTTYTFSNCSIPDLGSDDDNGVFQTNPHQRSPSRKTLVIIVHAIDALTVYTVSTVTLGGVGVSLHADGGGGIVANTAVAYDPASKYRGITTTDVVVTFSEAITSCAISILVVSNIGVQNSFGSVANNGTGVFTAAPSVTAFAAETFPVFILGSTCVTAAGGETVSFSPLNSGCVAPMLLYEASHAEATFAAAWTYSPQWNAGNTVPLDMNVSWSGAGAADCTGVCIV